MNKKRKKNIFLNKDDVYVDDDSIHPKKDDDSIDIENDIQKDIQKDKDNIPPKISEEKPPTEIASSSLTPPLPPPPPELPPIINWAEDVKAGDRIRFTIDVDVLETNANPAGPNKYLLVRFASGVFMLRVDQEILEDMKYVHYHKEERERLAALERLGIS